MRIQNHGQLASSKVRKDALLILEQGIDSAFPDAAISKIFDKTKIKIAGKRITLGRYTSLNIVAIGKSADHMTRVVGTRTRISRGMVVIPSGMSSMINTKKIQVLHAGHPIPTVNSVIAARRIIKFLKNLEPTALVIFLISGGASSLVSLPDGITLKNKQRVTNLLIKSGANIAETNCIRKHLSRVKGGRLLDYLGCHAVSFVVSDVIGDDLSVIASGITYCDMSTFSEAKRILVKYNLQRQIPRPVWKRILLGNRGKIPETPKKARIEHYVILSNKNSVRAMERRAKRLGYKTKTVWPIQGNVESAAKKISRNLPLGKNSCIIFGGETTVSVTGSGRGGRNQELVLYLLREIRKYGPEVVAACLGTDGIDGNSPAAGGIVTSDMYSSEVREYLDNNDSYCYLKKFRAAIFTGHTHANLMDIGLVLRN